MNSLPDWAIEVADLRAEVALERARAMRASESEVERIRERDEARADLARVTAERDEARVSLLANAEGCVRCDDERQAEAERLRAEGAAATAKYEGALNAIPVVTAKLRSEVERLERVQVVLRGIVAVIEEWPPRPPLSGLLTLAQSALRSSSSAPGPAPINIAYRTCPSCEGYVLSEEDLCPICHAAPRSSAPATVYQGLSMGGGHLAAPTPKEDAPAPPSPVGSACEACGDAGWLWGYELDDPDEDTITDTMTRYPCDKCGTGRATTSKEGA